MIDENRKGMRAVKRKIKPTSHYPGTKKLGPATPMTRKIHVAKNGVFKVKKHKYFEDLEAQLTNTLNEYQDRMAGVGMGDYSPKETFNGGGEYNDEVGMIKSDLHTIGRSAVELAKILGPDENLPEWAQEKIAQVKGMLTSVTDYMKSQHEQGDVFQTNESNGEHVSVLYIDGRPSTKYTNPKDAEKDLNTLKSKYPKKSFELKREIREDDLEEGWGKAALIGTAAFIAAIAGINHMQAQKLMHSDPQLAKLAQFRDRAVKMGDEDKVHELDDRIKVTLDHLQVTGDEIRGDDGKPVDPVYEDRWKFSGKTGGMERDTSDSDQRHGLYINGKLIRTYNTKDEAENAKRRDPKFKDATIKKIAESKKWTHDSLAKKLFEQEITYEDQLNGMLRRKLSK